MEEFRVELLHIKQALGIPLPAAFEAFHCPSIKCCFHIAIKISTLWRANNPPFCGGTERRTETWKVFHRTELIGVQHHTPFLDWSQRPVLIISFSFFYWKTIISSLLSFLSSLSPLLFALFPFFSFLPPTFFPSSFYSFPSFLFSFLPFLLSIFFSPLLPPASFPFFLASLLPTFYSFIPPPSSSRPF